MKLSPNFTLRELTRSNTALRHGIDNTPDDAAIIALTAWCVNIGEPVRAHFGRPVVISSGYRGHTLNALLGGADGSQHERGEAVDFEVMGIPNKAVCEFIGENLEYDQLIAEHLRKDDPHAGWVHCSYSLRQLRGEVLSCIGRGKYVNGIVLS